jgi:hypothetical protein
LTVFKAQIFGLYMSEINFPLLQITAAHDVRAVGYGQRSSSATDPVTFMIGLIAYHAAIIGQ